MTMQKLNKLIDYYLKSETNYALLVTGEWGAGKTFYFKNILQQQIKSTPIFNNNRKNYKPILISLFGKKSIEEIQTEIFLSLFPLLKHKNVKLGFEIGKFLIKGILSVKNLSERVEFISDLDVDRNDWIRFEEIVLCFDDLERVSRNLKIEEIIGYINSLVENENYKVIIIANEDKIDHPKYKLLKEKVIGNTIEFIPDIDRTFDSLLESNFESSPLYLSYLKENKNFILDLFKKRTHNLRTLVFFLRYFQTIFSQTVIGLSNQSALNQRKSEILLRLLKFSLIISIEYKEGKISFSNRADLDLHDGLDLINFSFLNFLKSDNYKNSKSADIQKSYVDELIDKFYKGDIYKFFLSVYDFITGGTIFRHEDIIQELKVSYHIEDGEILPQYEMFNRLNSPMDNCISDKENKKLITKLLSYCDTGSFELPYYLSIFIFAARFGNPLNFNISKLEKRIVSGIKKGIKNFKYDDHLHHNLAYVNDDIYKENLERIRFNILEVNDKLKLAEQKLDFLRLKKKCFEDFEGFSKEVLNSKNHYFSKPIFNEFKVHEFYLFFLRTNNNIKWKIIDFISTRYFRVHSDRLSLDVEFLIGLISKIKKKLGGLPSKGIVWFLFNEFSKTLTLSIEKLSLKN